MDTGIMSNSEKTYDTVNEAQHISYQQRELLCEENNKVQTFIHFCNLYAQELVCRLCYIVYIMSQKARDFVPNDILLYSNELFENTCGKPISSF